MPKWAFPRPYWPQTARGSSLSAYLFCLRDEAASSGLKKKPGTDRMGARLRDKRPAKKMMMTGLWHPVRTEFATQDRPAFFGFDMAIAEQRRAHIVVPEVQAQEGVRLKIGVNEAVAVNTDDRGEF